MKNFMLRGISLFVATAFTVTTLIGSPSEAMAVSEIFGQVNGLKTQTELRKDLYAMPAELGSLVSLWEPPAGDAQKGFVVHIQDAHANPEAQQNIAAMLKYLETKFPGLVVGLEGAAGELHPEYLNFFKAYPEANRAVIEDLHQKGELNAAELYLLGKHQQIKPGLVVRTSGFEKTENQNESRVPSPESRVFGVEDSGLYRDNLRTYRELLSRENEIQVLLTPVRAQLEKESSQKLNGELRNFLKERSRRKDGRFGVQVSGQSDPDFQAYIRYLRQQVLKFLEIDLKDTIEQLRFPNLLRIVMIEEARKGFDAEAAKSQWEEVVQSLESAAKDSAEKEFVKAFAAFGHEKGFLAGSDDSKFAYSMPQAIYPRKLLEGLFRFAQAHKLSFDGKEAFWKTWKLAVFQAEIDVTELMREMDTLEAQMIEKLARSEDEKALVRKLGNFDLLEKMLRLELSRPEYDKVLLERNMIENLFQGPETGDQRLATKSKVPTSQVTSLKSYYAAARHFYEVSLKRDEALVENTLALTRGTRGSGLETSEAQNESRGTRNESRLVVLYTGGFHTPGIEEILREKGIGYAVFAPRITKTDHGEMYRKVMTGENADLSAYFKVKNPFATKQAAIFFKEMLEVAAPALFEKYKMKPEEIADHVGQAARTHPVLSGAVIAEPVGPKESASLRFQSIGSRESVPQNSAIGARALTSVWRSSDAGEGTSVNLAASVATTMVSFGTAEALTRNIIQGNVTLPQTATLNGAVEATMGSFWNPGSSKDERVKQEVAREKFLELHHNFLIALSRSEMRQDKPREPEQERRELKAQPKTEGAIPRWIWVIPAAFFIFAGALLYLQSRRNIDHLQNQRNMSWEQSADQSQPQPPDLSGTDVSQSSPEMVFPTNPISILQRLYLSALEDQPEVITQEAMRVGARHVSPEWEGRHLEAFYGGHGHPDHGKGILELAPTILRETNQWVAVLEDATLLKAMSLPGLSDSQVLLALAESAHLPVIDPMEGLDHVSPPVLEFVSKKLDRELDEVKGASFYMAWLETLGLAHANGQDSDLQRLYLSYLEDLKFRGKYEPQEIERVLVKTAQSLDSNEKKEAFAALMSDLSRQTGAARGVLGAAQLRAKLKGYPNRKAIILHGGEYAKDFYGLPNLMHSEGGLIRVEHVNAVLNSLEDLKIITPRRSELRVGAVPVFSGIPLSLVAMTRLTRRVREQSVPSGLSLVTNKISDQRPGVRSEMRSDAENPQDTPPAAPANVEPGAREDKAVATTEGELHSAATQALENLRDQHFTAIEYMLESFNRRHYVELPRLNKDPESLCIQIILDVGNTLAAIEEARDRADEGMRDYDAEIQRWQAAFQAAKPLTQSTFQMLIDDLQKKKANQVAEERTRKEMPRQLESLRDAINLFLGDLKNASFRGYANQTDWVLVRLRPRSEMRNLNANDKEIVIPGTGSRKGTPSGRKDYIPEFEKRPDLLQSLPPGVFENIRFKKALKNQEGESEGEESESEDEEENKFGFKGNSIMGLMGNAWGKYTPLVLTIKDTVPPEQQEAVWNLIWSLISKLHDGDASKLELNLRFSESDPVPEHTWVFWPDPRSEVRGSAGPKTTDHGPERLEIRDLGLHGTTADVKATLSETFNRSEARKFVENWLPKQYQFEVDAAASALGMDSVPGVAFYMNGDERKARLWIAMKLLDEMGVTQKEGRITNERLQRILERVIASAPENVKAAISGDVLDGPKLVANLSGLSEQDWSEFVRDFPVLLALLVTLRASLSINVNVDKKALKALQKKFEALMEQEGISLAPEQLLFTSTLHGSPFESLKPGVQVNALFSRSEKWVLTYNSKRPDTIRWLSEDKENMVSLVSGLATALLYAASDKKLDPLRLQRPSEHGAVVAAVVNAILGYTSILEAA